MSDCRLGVSPVNYPDPDPEYILKYCSRSVSHDVVCCHWSCAKVWVTVQMAPSIVISVIQDILVFSVLVVMLSDENKSRDLVRQNQSWTWISDIYKMF